MMSCSSAYRRMKGPRSSLVRRMFLNTGCISEKCACNVIGTETSHSINQNMVPSRTSLRIFCDVIVHRTWRRRGKAASRHFFTTTTGVLSGLGEQLGHEFPVDGVRF